MRHVQSRGSNQLRRNLWYWRGPQPRHPLPHVLPLPHDRRNQLRLVPPQQKTKARITNPSKIGVCFFWSHYIPVSKKQYRPLSALSPRGQMQAANAMVWLLGSPHHAGPSSICALRANRCNRGQVNVLFFQTGTLKMHHSQTNPKGFQIFCCTRVPVRQTQKSL